MVKLVKSPNEVESQKKKLVRSLRNTRTAPFDVSFKINHYIGESHFKSPLKRVGLDVIITQPVIRNLPLLKLLNLIIFNCSYKRERKQNITGRREEPTLSQRKLYLAIKSWVNY